MKPMYIHLREPIVTAEEFETLFKKDIEKQKPAAEPDYSCWYSNPIAEAKFREELGVENAPPEAYQIAGTHYVDMKVQPWDVIDTWPDEQKLGFYRGNVLKYILRAGVKGPEKEDYKKAFHYLEKLIDTLD